MGKKVAALFVLLSFFVACAAGVAVGSGPEIEGVRLGMNREQARARLLEIGELEKEERKQQEVWRLKGEGPYSHLIVAYDGGFTAVRFVTAVARQGGRRVRYADVMDTGKARRTQAGDSITYTLDVAAEGGGPGYTVKAIGDGPDYLQYYSVERAE